MVSSLSWQKQTLAWTGRSQARLGPLLGFTAFAVVAAGLAARAPFQLTITSVFLFAGLHNWIELRYFLSKVPTRLGPLKSYFATATIGGIALSCLYIAMLTLPELFSLQAAWNTIFLSWICALVLLRSTQNAKRNFKTVIPVTAAVLAVSLIAPPWLTLALVYAHPLIGMAILDRELQRKPAWRAAYRAVLCALPLLAVLVFCAASSAMPQTNNQTLLWGLYRQSGGDFLPMLSASSLIALHAFLELLHYGVWLLAIPMVTMFRPSGTVRELPVARVSVKANRLVGATFCVATLGVIALWCAFSADYTSARQFYFTIAIVHMLAEIPFLIRLL